MVSRQCVLAGVPSDGSFDLRVFASVRPLTSVHLQVRRQVTLDAGLESAVLTNMHHHRDVQPGFKSAVAGVGRAGWSMRSQGNHAVDEAAKALKSNAFAVLDSLATKATQDASAPLAQNTCS